MSESDPWQGARGPRRPRRFEYTYKDLARLFCVSLSTVKHWCSRTTDKNGNLRPAKLNPRDLRSIAALYLERRSA